MRCLFPVGSRVIRSNFLENVSEIDKKKAVENWPIILVDRLTIDSRSTKFGLIAGLPAKREAV